MDKRERLKKQMDFIIEVDKVKNIVRQTYLADGMRKENDAEHSWHLALMAVLLKEYAQEDTYAYDEAGVSTKAAREEKAANRIFGLLPEDQGAYFMELWREFEEYESSDAKFARMLDNSQPLFLNDASQGKSWKEHGVKKSQIYKRNAKTKEGSQEIWEYMQELVEKHIQLGNVTDDKNETE